MLNSLVPQAYAQPSICGAGEEGGINLGDCLRLNNDTPISEVYSEPAFLVNLIVVNLFVFAGIAFFFVIIYAGYRFIAGGKQGAEEARKTMTTAVIGFLIMFSAYWIVQLIKIVTGADIPL